MSVGNDAWKGVVELGVESSLPLVERRIQEFRARKVKAMNDTDDEVVDGVVIFSNERFTREIEIGRDSSLFLSPPPPPLSPMHISLEISPRDFTCPPTDSDNLPPSSRKLEKWKKKKEKKKESCLMQDRQNSDERVE